MSRLDVVIFGATGFTGAQAALHMVRFAERYGVGAWGVAGRSDHKLRALMADVAKKTGADVSAVEIIIADVGDEQSLKQMCSRARVLVNACGPYRLYGEPVVRAAIEAETHYVDINGENQFMELMQLRYDSQARAKRVFCVSACGWDSVPADMGVMLLKDHFQGTINSVEEYLTASVADQYKELSKERGVINYGTWESLIYGVGNRHELPAIRKQLFPEKLPELKPKLCRHILHKVSGSWYLPFLGSDESVVHRSQRHSLAHSGERPAQFHAYFSDGTYLQSLLAIPAGLVFFAMTQFQFTRSLLLKYPKLFSMGMVTKQGPADEVMHNTHFKFTLVARGWAEGQDVDNTTPNKEMVAEVTGTNPGYGATVVCLLTCALTILKERQKMPADGGVVTPGTAFRDTSLVKILNESEFIKFEIVKND